MFYENENFKISIDDRNIEPSGLSNEKILKIILQNRNISDDEVSNFLQKYNINTIDPFEYHNMEIDANLRELRSLRHSGPPKPLKWLQHLF